MKRLLLLLVTITALLLPAPAVYAQPDQPLPVVGKGAILIDARSGEILYEKNSHEPYYPASTTKILTAILAIENLDMDGLVPIDAETPFTEGSRIYLLEGEVITVRDVLYGLLLESANDSAVALAKMISGTVKDFSVLMNAKAQELGARDSHFVNPNGLHEDDHLSTAYDLAMIARYAMENPVFREYVSTYQYTIGATNLQEARYLYNTNRLLYDNIHKVYVNGELRGCKYDGVTGIKTGYTSKAGGCLVAGARRGETELIAVTLGSTDMDRFADCIALLDYGFANYKTVRLLGEGEDLGTVPVRRGALREVAVRTGETAYATLPVEASENLLRTEVVLKESLPAPVKQGDAAGVVKVFAGDELLGEFPAIAAGDVEEGGLLSLVGIEDQTADRILDVLLILLLAAFLALAAYILIKRRQVQKRKKLRRQQREEERRRREQERERWESDYRRRRPY